MLDTYSAVINSNNRQYPITKCSSTILSLDTVLIGGVPLNVMEVINLPPEGSAERQQAFQLLQELGAQEFKGGRMPKSGEDVLVAVFNTPESAVKVGA